jgi:NAD(P)-dependent dehydrogenase (short-subunit alcohol dehydrogenase family)
MENKKVWIITGCSTGFGRELSLELLSQGSAVAVTARNTDDIQDIVGAYPDQSLALQLDVTNEEHIKPAVDAVMKRFGRIDVLVNNAGIGYFGSIEESDDTEVRKMFEINFFGLAAVTREVLPHMRKQRSGHVVNISSIAGHVGFPAVGYYNATKFAVEGYSEALSKELMPLGVKVTVVCPSGFRTDWAGRSANETPVLIEDYASTAGQNIKNIRSVSGRQPGDPVLGARAIMKAVEAEQPPLRLFLGAGALRGVRKKISDLTAETDAWEDTTLGADAPLD